MTRHKWSGSKETTDIFPVLELGLCLHVPSVIWSLKEELYLYCLLTVSMEMEGYKNSSSRCIGKWTADLVEVK